MPKDLLLFLSLSISGDVILVPLIYSIRLGFVGIYELYALIFAANICTDLLWYTIGRRVGIARVGGLPFLRAKPRLVERITELWNTKGGRILFASKFIYGTRSVTQILCGANGMRYAKYFFICIAGTAVWTSFLVLVITFVDASVSALEDSARKIQISIGLFILIVFGANYFLKKKFGPWLNG